MKIRNSTNHQRHIACPVPDKSHTKLNLVNPAVVVVYAKLHANQVVTGPHDKPAVLILLVISTLCAI